MLVDESLSKGLVKLLLTWWPDDLEKAFKGLKSKTTPSMFSSRKGLEKMKMLHSEELAKFALSYLQGGTKRKPYIGFVAINAVKERTYESWGEAGFFGEAVMTNFFDERQFTTSIIAPFGIGQHALARVYQRSKLINENNRSDPYAIIPELRMIPLWAGIWHYFYNICREIYADKYLGLNLLIPSPNGLFFAEMNLVEDDPFVEIRTYVHQSQLSDGQALIRNIFIEAIKGMENSLLSITPALPDITPKDVYCNELGCLLLLIKHRLKDHHDEIAQMMVGEQDNFKIYEIKKILELYFLAENINLETAAYLEELLSDGYEKFAYEFIHPSPKTKELLNH